MTVWNPPSSDGSYDDLDLADLADFNVDIIEVRDEMAYPDPTVIVRGLYRRRPRLDPQLFVPLARYILDRNLSPDQRPHPYTKFYDVPPDGAIPTLNPTVDTGRYDDLDFNELDVFENELIEIFWELDPWADPTLMVRHLYERHPEIDPELFSSLCTYTIHTCWPKAPDDPYEKWYK